MNMPSRGDRGVEARQTSYATTADGVIVRSTDGGTPVGRRAVSVGLVAVTLLISGLLPGQVSAVDPLESMGGLRPAKPVAAPAVVFATLEGREARAQDLRGKAVLLGFFATW